MSRYEDATENLVEVFLNVIGERFPRLINYKFKLIFDLKKRVKQGKLVLASIELASPKIKFFSADDVAAEGYDYVITVDKKVWELASDKDKARVISHELNHVFIDEKDNCKIIGHEISDFYIELKRNEDDPEWGRNLTSLISAVYEQEKEEAREARMPKKKGV